MLPRQQTDSGSRVGDAQLDTPYREGGWTVRQVVHHVADSHTNSYVRFKLALTEDWPTIKPYDEAAWANLADSRWLPVEVSLGMIEGLHMRWVFTTIAAPITTKKIPNVSAITAEISININFVIVN